MSIIKATNKFQGNSLEKNEQRVEMIKITKDDADLPIKIKKLIKYIEEKDLEKIQYVIENILFFEIVSFDIIIKYINKLNGYENIENDFKEVYILKAENGFRRTMDYLVRRMQWLKLFIIEKLSYSKSLLNLRIADRIYCKFIFLIKLTNK